MNRNIVAVTGSLGRFRTALTSAASAAQRLRAPVQQAGTAANQLRSSADQAAAAVRRQATAAASGGPLMGRLRQGVQGVTTAQRGLNAAMRANVMGMIITLVMMVVTKLVDMAMQSQRVRQIVQTAFRIIGQVINTVMDAVRKVISVVWPWIEAYVRTYINIVLTVIRTVTNVIRTVVTTVWNAISTTIRTVMNVVSSVVSGTWNGVRNTITGVVNGISSFLTGAWNRITGTLRGAWDGLAGFARSAFQAVLGAVRAPINAIIGLVNGAIRGLNSISVTIPDWVPGVGGRRFGLNLPQIPQLAEGGIALPTAGGLIVRVAEAGQAEAIVPLSKLPELLDLRSRRSGADQPVTVNVYPRAGQSEYEVGKIVARELAWAAKR